MAQITLEVAGITRPVGVFQNLFVFLRHEFAHSIHWRRRRVLGQLNRTQALGPEIRTMKLLEACVPTVPAVNGRAPCFPSPRPSPLGRGGPCPPLDFALTAWLHNTRATMLPLPKGE